MAVTTLNTSLADIAFGTPEITQVGASDIDQLIKERQPVARELLTQGVGEQLRLSELAQLEQTQPLEQFAELSAIEEQNALLGLLGAERQQQALGAIPRSAADLEANRRQRQTMLRQAAATGDIGSGAAILAAQDLGAQQQMQAVQGRLAELEPFAALARQTRSQLSAFDEAARTRQAQIQGGLGTQLANIRLGAAAPTIAGIQERAEISGLQGIGEAQQRAQTNEQLASLAGTFATSLSQPTQQLSTPTYIPVQEGFTNPNVSPVASFSTPNPNFSPAPQIQF